MKTNSNTVIICILPLLMVCVFGCSKRITYTYCDNFTNKDSLIQCILTNYDVDAYIGLLCCHTDSDMALYGYLVADSTGNAGFYGVYNGYNGYSVSDTAALFYEMKGLVMGSYILFGRNRNLDFPDSIYNRLSAEYRWYGVSVSNKEKYMKEYNNLDSLYNEVLEQVDIESYNKLRLLVSQDSLLSTSIEIANKTHYPVACYDVYFNMIQGKRLSDNEFRFAYRYLCEATDSMYYPAVFLKAGLCLTGAYFLQDTILGKELLEQCHCTISIPFWQQYSKPVVYNQLLEKQQQSY